MLNRKLEKLNELTQKAKKHKRKFIRDGGNIYEIIMQDDDNLITKDHATRKLEHWKPFKSYDPWALMTEDSNGTKTYWGLTK